MVPCFRWCSPWIWVTTWRSPWGRRWRRRISCATTAGTRSKPITWRTPWRWRWTPWTSSTPSPPTDTSRRARLDIRSSSEDFLVTYSLILSVPLDIEFIFFFFFGEDLEPQGSLTMRDNFKGCIRNVVIRGEIKDWTDMARLNNVLLNACPIHWSPLFYRIGSIPFA